MSKTIRFRNYSMFSETRHGSDYYDWCVFVDEPESVLDQIAKVEYRLHPTFSDPLRVVEDRRERFALYSSGWGEFTIAIQVAFKDGSETTTQHQLTLEADAWPKQQPEASQPFQGSQEASVYNEFGKFGAKWAKTQTLATRTGLSLPEVENALASLQARKLVRKAYFRSLDDQELWGATAKVGYAP